MALSIQNKKFLSLLHKLDVGLTYVNDQTFDGLFENIPEETNYFFNWFLENITEDNALTESEEAMYFEIVKNNQEEIDGLLPLPVAYEELQSLDVKHITSVLPDELQNLEKCYMETNDMYFNLESNCIEVKKKNVTLTESLNNWKKKLNTVTVECNNTISLVVNKFDEIKQLLLKEPNIHLDIDSYNTLFLNERSMFSNLKNHVAFENFVTSSSNSFLLSELQENLACVKNFSILSQGSLKEKKFRKEVLSKALQNCRSDNLNLTMFQDVSDKVNDSIQVLENEIKKKVSIWSQHKILKIEQENFLLKTELCQSQLTNLKNYSDYIKLNNRMNSWLLHILLMFLSSIENVQEARKELQTKFSEHERNCSVNIANFKLRKSRFGGGFSKTNQPPLLLALQNILHTNNLTSNDTSLEKLNDILSHVNEDSNFAPHNVRTTLKSSVKSLLNNKLCGSTSQLQFVPIHLFIKYEECDKRNKELSREMKRIVSRYVEIKETISKSSRRKLLSWIKFIANPEQLRIKVENLDKSVDRSRLFMSVFKES